MHTKYPMPAKLHNRLVQLSSSAIYVSGMIESLRMIEKTLNEAMDELFRREYPDVKLENISYSVAENCFYVKEEKKE